MSWGRCLLHAWTTHASPPPSLPVQHAQHASHPGRVLVARMHLVLHTPLPSLCQWSGLGHGCLVALGQASHATVRAGEGESEAWADLGMSSLAPSHLGTALARSNVHALPAKAAQSCAAPQEAASKRGLDAAALDQLPTVLQGGQTFLDEILCASHHAEAACELLTRSSPA